jgi:hypothetical protein
MGIYTESWSLYAGFVNSSKVKEQGGGVCVVPNDGEIAWTARDELGEATASLLETVRDSYSPDNHCDNLPSFI